MFVAANLAPTFPLMGKVDRGAAARRKGWLAQLFQPCANHPFSHAARDSFPIKGKQASIA
jgi:hypothetical protein